MTIPDLIETDVWPVLRFKIEKERAGRINDLVGVQTLDEMRRQQGFIECIDWVLEEAKPKPRPRDDNDE